MVPSGMWGWGGVGWTGTCGWGGGVAVGAGGVVQARIHGGFCVLCSCGGRTWISCVALDGRLAPCFVVFGTLLVYQVEFVLVASVTRIASEDRCCHG